MNNDFLAGWMASEDTEQDKITVKRAYIDINDGNVHDGLMFSQIMYWHGKDKHGKPRLSVKRDGYLWLVKSYTEWWDECRVNAHTARKCIDRITQRGLIVTMLAKFNGAPTIHIRLNYDGFATRIKSTCYAVSNPIDTTGQKEMTTGIKTLTETTTETTTEEKDIAPAMQDAPAKPPKKRSPVQLADDALVDALGIALGIPAVGKDYGNYLKVAQSLVEAGIARDEFARFVAVVKTEANGKWKVTPNALTANGRMSEYMQQRPQPTTSTNGAPAHSPYQLANLNPLD